MSVFKRPGSPFFYCEFVVAGRRICRSTGCTSARDAKAFERALKLKERNSSKAAPVAPALTLDQACARYWKDHGKYLRWAPEVERHITIIAKVIDRDMPLSDIGNKEVAALIAMRRADGVTHATINRTTAVLRGLHKYAAEHWDASVRAIAWRKHMLKEPQERVRWLTSEIANLLLDSLPPHIELVVRFLLLTGLRKTEAFSLTWDRVHLDRMTIEVVTKGGIRREFAISAAAALVLQQCPRGDMRVFDTTNARKHFDAACRAAGITDFRWHDLRHTFATWMRRGGAPLEVVSRALGHSTIAVTQRYAHVDQAEVRAALQQLPSIGTNNDRIAVFKPRKRKYNLL